jgi:hypothetical protein
MPTLREYYHNVGLTDSDIENLNEELQVLTFKGLTESVHPKRLQSLNQAKGTRWHHGPAMTGKQITEELKMLHTKMSTWNRKASPVYRVDEYTIGAARPGKEAALDYTKIRHYSHCTCDECKTTGRVQGVNNPHDMFPYVEHNDVLMSVKRKSLKNGTTKVTPWTFEHIFSMIEVANDSEQTKFALELMGSIMVRVAFMLDHHKDKNGDLMLELPKLTTQEMVKRLPELGPSGFSVPIQAVIFFLDILGYNEDIKVDVCGYRDLQREYARGTKPQDNGRTNTLLTISHMLAAVLHRRPIGEFAYGLHRGMGMNPMSKGTIHPAYPLLSSDLNTLLDEDITELGWSP